MGTRNLTMVVMDGQTRIAQYGQWDGYLSGQGQTILDFLNGRFTKMTKADDTARIPAKRALDLGHVENEGVDLDQLRAQLDKCRFGTDEEIEAMYAPYTTDGMMNLEQSERFKKSPFAYLSHDVAAEILMFVYVSDADEIVLSDMSGFANNSLFCEYAYVVDMDNEVLEIYRGFQKAPPAEDERFAKAKLGPPDDWEPRYPGEVFTYYPVQLAAKHTFAELRRMTELPALPGEEDDEG